MNNRFLELSKISKAFDGPSGRQLVVKDFDLKVSEGEFIALIGHSGCGKSTVLAMVAGLQQSTEGAIIVGGRQIIGPGPDRGVVFQSPSLFHWMSALDNVVLGVAQVHPGKTRAQHEAVAKHYLALVGLDDSFHKKPAEMSSGMRQRVGLARAFALTPRVLLLDEPFGMLDSLTRVELQEVLLELWRQDKKTALMVTHDVDEALFLSDRVVMMTQGPEAKVGDTLCVPFERPRDRRTVMEDPRYYELRERIIGFLEHNEPRSKQLPMALASAELPADDGAAVEAVA